MKNNSENNSKTVVVIGAGPAGMLAAGVLSRRGKRVVLIEKNKLLGKKLRITGKGRCNITNNCEIEDIIANICTNPSFMYSALYTFTNDNLIELINSLGVETKVERGGRVFPVSDKAADVADALKRYALDKNTRLVCDEVAELVTDNGAVMGVKLKSGETISADSVIIATGGMSYPLTGSTGDGYKFAKQCGHTIIPPKASLVPIETDEPWVEDAMGLSLKNVKLSVLDAKNKIVYSNMGEMLFTHFGVSGPLVLSASSHIKLDGKNKYRLVIDLKPALDEKQLDARLVRDFEKNSRKQFSNSLSELLPKKLIDCVVALSGIEADKFVHQITKDERKNLVHLLKNITLGVKKFRPVSEAIITSGGVNVREINSSTMESKIISGLYFAGEVIDVDAYTGGFNLQIAFSTAYLAASNA